MAIYAMLNTQKASREKGDLHKTKLVLNHYLNVIKQSA